MLNISDSGSGTFTWAFPAFTVITQSSPSYNLTNRNVDTFTHVRVLSEALTESCRRHPESQHNKSEQSNVDETLSLLLGVLRTTHKLSHVTAIHCVVLQQSLTQIYTLRLISLFKDDSFTSDKNQSYQKADFFIQYCSNNLSNVSVIKL